MSRIDTGPAALPTTVRPQPTVRPALRRPAGSAAMVLLGLLALLLGSIPAQASPRQPTPRLPTATAWPLPGGPPVVRGFDPPAEKWGRGHRGVDLAGQPGGPVAAAAAGTVSYAGMLAGRGVLVVDHGAVRTTYEPVSPTVDVGATVVAGQQIGTLDAGHCGAGRACLHWGLRRGDSYLDPLLLAPDRTVADTTDQATGDFRLVAADERAAAVRRAAARRAARLAAEALGVPSTGGGGGGLGPAGSHGFSHPVAAAITSPFGMRFHPVLHVNKLHDGTDFGAACGTPIRAPAAGTVSARYFNAGYGNRLMLDHGVVDGHRVVSGFNHATSYAVGVGDRVAKGQLVGSVGSTGFSTGCHLHLMVWLDGKVVDPLSWY
ncbi:peptidoglycan DD-metalloendopeptidase family protein [Microlunatus soli]|uniref:Peptidase family M23 n=1 Tax=Microlunatus soli TaxID=630515 RepID=A0A1H1NX40_9ACTN|nr:peptidoglycan DD-metalloendopeptidase family protein [Microlunatus soli]SDS03360.1 Peptidase family M23 [Microlunatus soli]